VVEGEYSRVRYAPAGASMPGRMPEASDSNSLRSRPATGSSTARPELSHRAGSNVTVRVRRCEAADGDGCAITRRRANMCSCCRLLVPRPRSCTPISTRSTRRSSSVTIRRCEEAGRGGRRGVVLAASYEAKAFGVRTAMSGGAARRLCPNLIEVPPRFDAYTEASTAVFEIFRRHLTHRGTDVDRRGVHRRRRALASRRYSDRSPRRCVPGSRARSGCRSAWEWHARSSSPRWRAPWQTRRTARGRTRRRTRLPAPAPVQRLWGVGTVTAAKLHERGVHTVADVAALSPEVLTAIVGRSMGHQLHALSHNRDARRVTTGRRRSSIGSQQALGRRGGHATRSTSCCGASSIASPAACVGRIASGVPSRSGSDSTI
jgi:hypothetical protein